VNTPENSLPIPFDMDFVWISFLKTKPPSWAVVGRLFLNSFWKPLIGVKNYQTFFFVNQSFDTTTSLL
jgi:hypothetical protein